MGKKWMDTFIVEKIFFSPNVVPETPKKSQLRKQI